MNILLISPFFAPYGLVGAQRINSLANYLINKKHEVTVIALAIDYYMSLGCDGLNSTIPEGVSVVRFDVELNVTKVYARNKNYAKAFYECANELLSKRKFDIAIISLGPFFTLRSIPNLCKEYNLPYLLDYRDLNSLEPLKSTSYFKRLKEAAMKINEYRIDKKAILSAKAVITVTSDGKRKIEKGFGVHEDKVYAVLNGFDDCQLKCLPKIEWEKDTEISIGYFGKFMYYDIELGTNILNAISNLRKKGVYAKLYHIGPRTFNIYKILKDKNIDLESYVYLGSKSYLEGMAYLEKMECCALEWKNPYGYGTKVFDYIYLNKPIIASINKSTELANFLTKFKNAFISETTKGLESAMLQMVDKNLVTLDDDINLWDFSRTKQNIKFEKIIERYLE